MRWVRREIEAPAADTLSAAEVAVALGYSDPKSVMRLVDDGRFPEPIDGDNGREWLWEDVVWFRLDKRARARLRKALPQTDDATPLPDALPRTRRTRGQSRDSTGEHRIPPDSGSAEAIDG